MNWIGRRTILCMLVIAVPPYHLERRQLMAKAYHSTRTIPACVWTCATGLVLALGHLIVAANQALIDGTPSQARRISGLGKRSETP